MRPYLGSQTPARGAKDNPVHNGSTKAGSEVSSFNLLGPGWRNEPFPAGKPESKFRLAFAHLPGEDLTTLLYPISLPANGSVFGPVRPDQA